MVVALAEANFQRSQLPESTKGRPNVLLVGLSCAALLAVRPTFLKGLVQHSASAGRQLNRTRGCNLCCGPHLFSRGWGNMQQLARRQPKRARGCKLRCGPHLSEGAGTIRSNLLQGSSTGLAGACCAAVLTFLNRLGQTPSTC